ncbi:ABC-F family ATP-binding cassette domain-containing protein [Sciscionella sediminilitoris]|uniref:ABC-F family ATP-binding cassette domain-containing protein n=1 Tax=Sciscionella sediminilitoris TaxID=1445613 RepID=UPI0004DF4B34|nr:ABC-F family ATP-binding cassette domain-containing protein [Sciscionella sp. SE31]
MSVLQARELVKSYGARTVLSGVSLTLSPGQRTGLVGDNGVGKSTLLRVLAGREARDGGTVEAPSDLGFLTQEPEFPGSASVAEVLDDALAEVRVALRRLDELAERIADSEDAMTEYGEVLDWCTAHEAWDADRRAELVLDGLGLGFLIGATGQRRIDTLSGGERTRLALAMLLVRRPGMLLLDEPTNHLDDAAIAFLEEHLRGLSSGVLVASHDRVFLDEVCTDILDLDPNLSGPARYTGAFTAYLGAKRAERERWERQYATEQEELKALRSAVRVNTSDIAHNRKARDNDKFIYAFKGARVQQTAARRVRDAKRRLEELEQEQVRKPPPPLRFSGAWSAGNGSGPVLSLHQVRVGQRLAVDRLDVNGTDALLVTGANGAGKSTLLGVLAGDIAPDSGELLRRKGTRIGLLRQDVWFAERDKPAARLYADAVPEGPNLGELGLLPGPALGKPVGQLSEGQRRRLALALLVAANPHVLLLDEPTNHISLTLASELEDALRAAPGAVVVATHDRWLRRRWDGAHLELVGGGLQG